MLGDGDLRTETSVSWLTLFAAGGTLLCCALPIVLVTLGFGSVVAAVTSNFPLLISLATHKVWVFTVSGVLLLLSAWLMYRPGRTCPSDPALARTCLRAQTWNQRVFWGAALIWCIGFFAAYLALPIRVWLER